MPDSLAAERPVGISVTGEQLRELFTGVRSFNPLNRSLRTRMCSGVTGKPGDRLPMSIAA
ncbi:MAG: hypothetical protein R3B95_04030 [Nitrospirales bacterium]|nr:hypothetical protein [Nitrospirales bacterium]